jgi:hypothetical protein
MKALLTLMFLGISVLGISTLQAQNCAYKRGSCDSYSARKHCMSSCTRSMATLDQGIIQIPDGDNHGARFLRKTVCSYTGTVSYQAVEFDHQNGQFVARSTGQKASPNQSSCKIQCLRADQTLASSSQTRT